MSTRFVHVLAASLAFFIFVGAPGVAHADSKGDWSQFIEKPGDRPVVNKPAAGAQAPKSAKSAKPAKPTAKRAAKSSKKKH